ncbi:MAG: hypothetical protein Q4D62_16150, partial [Planctomycetia bacterium]|nr:hypothetical protein [Planctomycetia bacterium]
VFQKPTTGTESEFPVQYSSSPHLSPPKVLDFQKYRKNKRFLVVCLVPVPLSYRFAKERRPVFLCVLVWGVGYGTFFICCFSFGMTVAFIFSEQGQVVRKVTMKLRNLTIEKGGECVIMEGISIFWKKDR